MGEEVDKDNNGESQELSVINEEIMNDIVDKEIDKMNCKALLDTPLTVYEKKVILNEMLKEMQQKAFDMNSKIGNLYSNSKEVQVYLREQKRKELKLISRKRFRKLLLSSRYNRKEIEKIIEVEYKSKGFYDVDDFRYWRSLKNGIWL